ncbi:hypothetical protein [Ruegeria atlantica]|uniref:hypothetical protein n=1 Tax=Ruegeria atlantica TaxID=81569 RepID=UPI001481745D|nr:hypothetical protein [Ruegeria atlantica]
MTLTRSPETETAMKARVLHSLSRARAPGQFRKEMTTLYCRAGHAGRMNLVAVMADALWDKMEIASAPRTAVPPTEEEPVMNTPDNRRATYTTLYKRIAELTRSVEALTGAVQELRRSVIDLEKGLRRTQALLAQVLLAAAVFFGFLIAVWVMS